MAGSAVTDLSGSACTRTLAPYPNASRLDVTDTIDIESKTAPQRKGSKEFVGESAGVACK